MTDCILEADLAAMIGSITDTVLTRPSAQSMLTLATGWVLCRARHTTTGLILAARAVHRKHFSSYHRLFSSAAWCTQHLWLAVLRLVVSELCPVGELVLVRLVFRVATHAVLLLYRELRRLLTVVRFRVAKVTGSCPVCSFQRE